MSDSIDAYLRHITARGFARDTTVKYCGITLRQLDRELPMGIERATVEELEDWLANPDFTVQSQSTYFTRITGYFRWITGPSAPARLQLDYDPSAGLRRPKVPAGVPHPVTNAELVHALAELKDPWRTFVLLAAYEGMRAGEVANAERRDVTEQRTRILGKGRKVRVLKTHFAVWESVEPFPAGRLARRITTGEEADPGYVSSRMILQFKRIGLPDVTLHRFRHWYGTMMLRPEKYGGAGASLRTVQENMGHASPETTARYTLVCDEERDAAIDALPIPFLNTSAPC